MQALDGALLGFCVYALVKTTPSDASASIAGVLQFFPPYAPKLSLEASSAIQNKMLGNSFSPLLLPMPLAKEIIPLLFYS